MLSKPKAQSLKPKAVVMVIFVIVLNYSAQNIYSI
jgi:hypothetical protein